MKTIWLFIYIWHAHGNTWDSRTQMGGPSMTITPMPSIATCEEVGKQAKDFADLHSKMQRKSTGMGDPYSISSPAEYRCVEVAK